MKKTLVCLAAVLFLSGCATPVIHMVRKSDGQKTHCGGDVGASIAGGLAGYYLQQGKDNECVKLRQSEGFEIKRIETK